jgi:hypothetical protein
MTPRINSVCLETTMANSQMFVTSFVKLLDLYANHMTIISAAGHTGIFCGNCKLSAVSFNVSSSNDDMLTVLHSSTCTPTCYGTLRPDRGLLMARGIVNDVEKERRDENISDSNHLQYSSFSINIKMIGPPLLLFMTSNREHSCHTRRYKITSPVLQNKKLAESYHGPL